MRFWSDVNPYWVEDTNSQDDPRVMVWCGIWGDRIIGPFFFEGTVTGESNLQMLEEKVWPQISESPELSEALFQQGGAPGHWAVSVRNWLDNKFPRRWIGRGGPIAWPPRSPDLTPLDFFLWGYLKSQVYVNRPRTLDQLKTNIEVACNTITVEMLKNVRFSWETRLKYCIAIKGKQFEHLIK